MPRRIADYPDTAGWTQLNQISTIGAAILGVGVIPFIMAVVLALRKPATEPANPWGGGTLEWWTDSPPPAGNFRDLPPIRSNRPVLDAARAGDLR
jgi:heme/copper-type cytochrome/quinol oxidase subunit 1